MLLGAIDGPGSFLYKPPFPRPTPPHKKNATASAAPGEVCRAEPLGFPSGPEDLAGPCAAPVCNRHRSSLIQR